MATVIFSNMGDTDTDVLRYIWMGMPKVKVVEITQNTVDAMDKVNAAIEQEHDTLIMCGHGTPSGLMNTSFKDGTYLINSTNFNKIKCNRVIGIWCHASEFAQNFGVKGFFSSMFISNKGEASMNQIYGQTDRAIWDQEILFCIRLNRLIKEYVPMKQWIDLLKAEADYTNPVVKFNYDGLSYYKTAPTPKYKYGYASYNYGYGTGYGTGVVYTGTTAKRYDDWTKFAPKSVVDAEKAKTTTTAKTPDVVVLEDDDVKTTRHFGRIARSEAQENFNTVDDFTGIDLEEDYPCQVWGCMD